MDAQSCYDFWCVPSFETFSSRPSLLKGKRDIIIRNFFTPIREAGRRRASARTSQALALAISEVLGPCTLNLSPKGHR